MLLMIMAIFIIQPTEINTQVESMEDNFQKDNEMLREKASEFAEKYFSDMSLEDDSIVTKIFYCDENGEKCFSKPHEWGAKLNVHYYWYVVDTLNEGRTGEVDDKTRTVTIAPEYLNDDVTLLHELIHVFEGLYPAD